MGDMGRLQKQMWYVLPKKVTVTKFCDGLVAFTDLVSKVQGL